MHCAQLAHHKSDDGSAVTGFSLVAPLMTIVFLCVLAISAVLGQRVVLSAAASSGARMAATLGSTHGQAQREVNQVLESFSINSDSVSTSIWRGSISGVPAVYVRVQKSILIPWIHSSISIDATSHRIDENS